MMKLCGSPSVDRQHLGVPAIEFAPAHSAPVVEDQDAGLIDEPSIPQGNY
jgi:hypothetical protein